MAGAFQTSRDIFENPIWQNIVEFRLFFLLYGKATFAEGVRVGDITLERGQWIRSVRNLQSDLEYIENRAIKKYSLSTIHRAIDNLVKQNRISVKQCELGTLFTVINYAKYQGLENYKSDIENAERTQSEQQENGDRTERERRQNNNKNANNTKKDNKVKYIGDLISEFTTDEELKTTIQDFIEMRKLKKKPPTTRAMKDIFKKLNVLSPDISIQIKILEQSILNSWTDVYPLKNNQSQSSNPFA